MGVAGQGRRAVKEEAEAGVRNTCRIPVSLPKMVLPAVSDHTL